MIKNLPLTQIGISAAGDGAGDGHILENHYNGSTTIDGINPTATIIILLSSTLPEPLPAFTKAVKYL